MGLRVSTTFRILIFVWVALGVVLDLEGLAFPMGLGLFTDGVLAAVGGRTTLRRGRTGTKPDGDGFDSGASRFLFNIVTAGFCAEAGAAAER